MTAGGATHVLLSFRAPTAGDGSWPLAEDDWVADHLDEDTFATYLRRTHGGRLTVGKEWEEFVTRGCSAPRHVVLRVESVDGGDELDDRTEIEFVPRRDMGD